jgi:hypothetical protein
VPSLEQQARDFAGRLNRLLNTTICDGGRISVITRQPGTVLAGFGLTRQSVTPTPFPTIDGRCWLRVGHQLHLDDEGEYLTVRSSAYGIYLDSDARQPLCRFDYERGKAGHPEAHVQVYGTSEVLRSWPAGEPRECDDDCLPGCALPHSGLPTAQLREFHFPAGDRRYRPTLEDVIEFLITEDLVTGRPGWRAAVNASRDYWRRLQLSAAIRRDPETARQVLLQVGVSTAEIRKSRTAGKGDRRP